MVPNSTAQSSGELGVGADQVITANPSIVTTMTLRSGTGASLLAVKSGATIKWSLSLIATTAAGDQVTSVTFPAGLRISGALTVTVSGAGALAYVGYIPG